MPSHKKSYEPTNCQINNQIVRTAGALEATEQHFFSSFTQCMHVFVLYQLRRDGRTDDDDGNDDYDDDEEEEGAQIRTSVQFAIEQWMKIDNDNL